VALFRPPFASLAEADEVAPTVPVILGKCPETPWAPRMPVDTDTQLQNLVDLAKNGDARAKTLLLDHACERLLKLTRKMFSGYPGRRRWEQTDDVFQNSLIRFHRALAAVHLKSVRHFFNLAGEQVRRELLDLKKRYYGTYGEARNHQTDHQPPDEAGGSISSHSAEPDDLDRWAEFHTGVESLPKEQKEVVDLLYYDDLSQQEAAELLGIGVRTVKRRWQAAKLRLHEVLCDKPG